MAKAFSVGGNPSAVPVWGMIVPLPPTQRRRSLALLGSSSLLVLVGVTAAAPTPAHAACTTTADCYGRLFTRGIVTFNADGSVQQVVSGGPGGGISETVPGAVSGNQTGVLAINTNDGALNVTTNGDVTGIDSSGILAIIAGSVGISDNGWPDGYASGTGTNLIVRANGKVEGGNYGISTYNIGTGFTSVTATGNVMGADIGIDARNETNAKDLAVEAATVSGGNTGIRAINLGDGGSTSVTVGGHVTATHGTGIDAYNSFNAKDLTVEAATVNGGATGISAINYGIGSTKITASGAVTGIDAYGVLAANGVVNRNGAGVVTSVTGPSGTDLTVEAASVSGNHGGILAVNTGTGNTSVHAAGDVTGISGAGIMAIAAQEVTFHPSTGALRSHTSGAGMGLTVTADARVTGASDGIFVWNYGGGATSVTAKGDVVGTSGYGIDVNGRGTDLTVTADASVSGGIHGIYADNRGTGATQVVAEGDVTGGSKNGIEVLNYGTTLTVNATSASGWTSGIRAQNNGAGATLVTASGGVSGEREYGIHAVNGASAGDLTVKANAVSGGDTGIFALNSGTHSTEITTSGDVTGTGGDGIHVLASGTDLTVTAAKVSGGDSGIYVGNTGTGATSVTANGDVTATGEDGIHVSTNGMGLTVKAGAKVSGDGYGIYAASFGTDATSVTAGGDVTAVREDGIHVVASGTDLTVTAARVSGGGDYGIYAGDNGTGTTSVTATGAVTGAGSSGIYVYNSATTSGLTVKAAGASGRDYGIYAGNFGGGATSVTANGVVEGGAAGLMLQGTAPANVTVAASGELRNASGLAAELAVETNAGATTLTNEGRITGRLAFQGAFGDQVANKGTWITSGISDFGAGADSLTNETSGIISATGTTQFDNLETLVSNGLVTMQNGTAGNRIATSAAVTLAAGSTLGVDLNAAGAADGIDTAGTANISGSTLNVAALGVKLGRYTIVTTGGGLTGTFAAVTGTAYAFLGFADNYDSYNAYLDVSQVRDFTDAALTPNQRAAAGGTQSTAGGPLFDAVLRLPTDAAARAAFDQVSGEVHASAKAALIDDSRFVRNAAIDRVRSAFDTVGSSGAAAMAFADANNARNALAYAAPTKAPSFPPVRAEVAGPVLWGQAFGSWGHSNGDGNAARLGRQTGGLVTGGDMAVLDTWRLGLMAGYSRTSLNVRDRASSGVSDNYHVGIYGGTQAGSLGFRAGAVYSWHDISTSRSVALPGFADSLKGDYRAGTAQAFGELAYGIRIGSFGFEPFVNAAYVNLHTDGFVERGGAAALQSARTTTGVAFTTLGLHLSSGVMLGSVAATARGTLGWRHALDDVTPLSTFALAGGSPFAVAGVPIARDAAVIDAGLDFALAKNATLGISYTGQFASRATDQSIKGNLAIRF